MSDEPENIEPTEDKPKRKYVRKTFVGNDRWDDAINAEVEAAVHDVIDEADIDIIDPEDGVEVEEIDGVKPLRFLGEEPTSDSVKAKVGRALGLFNTMELKPWSKLDRWVCSKCGWQSFDRERARLHRC